MTEDKLPELPNPAYGWTPDYYCGWTYDENPSVRYHELHLFTEDQMQAYARQAVQEAVEAEREFHRRVLKRLHIGRDLYEETAAAIRGTTSQPAKEKT
jgi:hypothetical protein